MTAVASPPSFQSTTLPRNGWPPDASNSLDVNAMSGDEVSRMFVPRRSAQRTNSSSSLSSNSSSSSTSTTTTAATSQQNGTPESESGWGARKRPARGLWPSSRAEPVSSISTAPPQSITAGPSGPSAASAVSALHSPSQYLPSQHMVQPQALQNGTPRGQLAPGILPVLVLSPTNKTFERKTISFYPDTHTIRIGRQTNQRSLPQATNGFFDSKVLSRQHAEVWPDRDGKIWIRDVKSSNGTFVNGTRLSPENRESEPHLLKENDRLELGIDIVSEDQKSVVHHKVAAKVEHAGPYNAANGNLDSVFSEFDSQGTNGASQPTGQGFRSRNSSQGSLSSTNSRFGGASSNGVAAYHSKWLQPVTMEQIVKRLNSELKQARLQSQDLQHANTFVHAVISNDDPHTTSNSISLNIPPPPLANSSKLVSPPRASTDAKSRFAAEPPAPPPSHPLPEKPPSVQRPISGEIMPPQPQLRRADTERQKVLNVNGVGTGDALSHDEDHYPQISSLIEALTAAKRDLAYERERKSEMEELLKKERQARSMPETNGHDVTSEGDIAPNELLRYGTGDGQETVSHQRLSLMRAEMEEMKLQMEKYRQRAEVAETESQRDRETLAEMIESIRKRDDAFLEKKKKALVARREKRLKTRENKAESTPHGAVKSDEIASTDAGEAMDDLDDSDEFEKDLWVSDADLLIATEEVVPAELMEKAIGRAGPIHTSDDTTIDERQRRAKHLNEHGSRGAGDGNNGIQDSSTGQWQTAQLQFVQSGPYLSIVGVVLIGVGVMAVVNGWSKGEK